MSSADIVASLPFADDPRLLLLIMSAVVAWLLMDQIKNGGQWLAKLLRQNNADRMVMRDNITFNNGTKLESVAQIHFVSDALVDTPYGARLMRRAILYNDLGADIWVGNDRQLRIPLEALTTGEPCTIEPFRDEESDFEEEREEYKRRIAVLEGEKNEAWSNMMDNAKRVAITMGAIKKELGGTIMMNNRGQGGFNTGNMPFAGEGGVDG